MNEPYLVGMAVGLSSLEGLKFDPTVDHAGCKLCGAVYQSDLDRVIARWLRRGVPKSFLKVQIKRASDMRMFWRVSHSKTCPNKSPPVEVFAPQAMARLAPLGIIPLNPSKEVAQAMLEAPRAPLNDVEGT